MPRMNGIEAASRITKENPSVRIVALTMHSSEEYVYSLLKAGARGYILKDSAPSDLIEAIRSVARGGTYLHPDVSAGRRAVASGASARCRHPVPSR